LNIGIVGSGIVGQATGIGLNRNGHNVKFHDIDYNRLIELRNKGYDVTESIDDIIDHSEAIFVCVPTPTVGNEINLNIISEVTKTIANALYQKNSYTVISFRSTIPPQTTRIKLIPLLEEGSHLMSGVDFGVCMNPEFLREKTPLDDFLTPNRIVIGALDQKSGDLLKQVYSPFSCPKILTDLDTAEMIKYTSNTFLAAKISFFNEIYLICRKLGIDEITVSKAVSLDPRIGNYGVKGGAPFAGMCLPKDLQAFIHFTTTKGINPILLKAIAEVNEQICKSAKTSQEHKIELELPQAC
jgi:UDPglucose 6-dehydrogenase